VVWWGLRNKALECEFNVCCLDEVKDLCERYDDVFLSREGSISVRLWMTKGLADWSYHCLLHMRILDRGYYDDFLTPVLKQCLHEGSLIMRLLVTISRCLVIYHKQ
jgi:hypothetical protein